MSMDPAPIRAIHEVKADLFRALAHSGRIRILEVLVDGERSVSAMQPLVGLEASHLSQQLAILRRFGLLLTRREGASVIYRIADPTLIELMAVAKRLLIQSLTDSQVMLADLLTDAPDVR